MEPAFQGAPPETLGKSSCAKLKLYRRASLVSNRLSRRLALVPFFRTPSRPLRVKSKGSALNEVVEFAAGACLCLGNGLSTRESPAKGLHGKNDNGRWQPTKTDALY
jgi:hypothetical protein